MIVKPGSEVSGSLSAIFDFVDGRDDPATFSTISP